ncbi:MAG: DUF1015 domain-containing protein [Deltaproteobacteria bacterium]|nr:DUF1015 domain-containing protein [Deltaproteobacteria bacterium]
MSLVFPFKALRPAKSFVRQIAAPPYDVMSCAEAQSFVGANPLSFLHVEKSEIDVPDATGVDDRRIYDRARSNLMAMIDKGVFRRDDSPAFYLYRQRLGGHVQTGIVAGVSIAEYESGRIRRHELTRDDKERERTSHIDAVGAQTGPVMLVYRGRDAIESLTAKVASRPPEYDFTAGDGVDHTVWVIDDPAEKQEIVGGFAAIEALYIADGHHRAAAAAAVARLRKGRHPSDRGDEAHHRLMAVLFPEDQLRIMDYNRAVRDLNGLSEKAYLERVGERFLISGGFAQKSPARRHEFGMYLGGTWRRIEARKEILRDEDPIAGLDVSLLQDHLLGPILGIRDQRTDGRIAFIGGSRGMVGLERLVDQGDCAVAFSLYPPTVGEMMAVADTGAVMPPKSTWFEPKLLSGLFVHLLTAS